jgi:hypothetical protein
MALLQSSSTTDWNLKAHCSENSVILRIRPSVKSRIPETKYAFVGSVMLILTGLFAVAAIDCVCVSCSIRLFFYFFPYILSIFAIFVKASIRRSHISGNIRFSGKSACFYLISILDFLCFISSPSFDCAVLPGARMQLGYAQGDKGGLTPRIYDTVRFKGHARVRGSFRA